jgi:hypothetical protein
LRILGLLPPDYLNKIRKKKKNRLKLKIFLFHWNIIIIDQKNILRE